jgi:hypothetical protein
MERNEEGDGENVRGGRGKSLEWFDLKELAIFCITVTVFISLYSTSNTQILVTLLISECHRQANVTRNRLDMSSIFLPIFLHNAI